MTHSEEVMKYDFNVEYKRLKKLKGQLYYDTMEKFLKVVVMW